ncbi:glycosyltransferase [Paenibacillus sp. NPDC058071]|uniref:glycosyltransferase n=1 Tax=Paenibacillus sp. NPDC058071 TaxID=3346326 RepID=UPI0036DFA3C4
MKIAYLIHWNEGPESGVFKKVVEQMTEWRKLSHEVALFLFTSRPDIAWGEYAPGITCFVSHYSGRSGRFKAFSQLAQSVREWEPDAIYHRFDLYYGPLPSLLRAYPSVLEINTNDLSEMRMEKGLRYYYHRLTRGLVLKAASGFVFVSEELASEPHFKRYVRNYTTIGNGIRLDDYGSSTPLAASSSVRFVFIGSAGQSWHGIDEMAALADARPDWQFDMIGSDADELTRPAPDNMHFHGKLCRTQYQSLMDSADIAIGTLALHRKGMNEASPLKVREYLANGLPVIIGYRDTDFAAVVPFLLELPNEADNIVKRLEAIDAFAARWKGRRVDRESLGHLDTAVKEAQRVDYMNRIASAKGKRQ